MKIELNPRTLPEARAELLRVSEEAGTLEQKVTQLEGVRVEDSQPYKDLKVSLDQKTTDLSAKDTEITTLKGQLTAKDTEITMLKDQVANVPALTTDKAIEFLAAQGLAPLKVGEQKPGTQRPKSKANETPTDEPKGRERAALAWAGVGAAATV